MNSKLVDSIAVNNETSGHQLEMILFIGPNLKKIKIYFNLFFTAVIRLVKTISESEDRELKLDWLNSIDQWLKFLDFYGLIIS